MTMFSLLKALGLGTKLGSFLLHWGVVIPQTRAAALCLREALSYLRRAHGSGQLPIITPWKHLAAAVRDREGHVGWHQNGNSLSWPRSPERATSALACRSSHCFGYLEITLESQGCLAHKQLKSVSISIIIIIAWFFTFKSSTQLIWCFI